MSELNLNLPKSVLALSSQSIAIRLRPSAEKRVRKEKHPWIFDESIKKQNKEGRAGDLAVIFDNKKDKFLACGLYDPDSPIRIKLFQFGKPAKIDKSWFEQKVAAAYEIRKPFLETDTNAYRLIFGENDKLPGLIADVYDEVVVMKLYSAMWFPYLSILIPAIINQVSCKTLVVRLSRSVGAAATKLGIQDGTILYGTLASENVIIREHGVRFKVNVIKGHKTGFFLDHRHNRLAIGKMSKGKDVLDVFSYAGGFSVHALVGGAATVTSLDVSKQALKLAIDNGKLNVQNDAHDVICDDAFEALSEMIRAKRKFDIIIIDPPAFAKRAKEVDRAIESYTKLARLGSQLVGRGGTLILASCSSRVTAEVFFEVNRKALLGTRLELHDKTFHDIDHPIGFKEGAYLKAGYYQ